MTQKISQLIMKLTLWLIIQTLSKKKLMMSNKILFCFTFWNNKKKKMFSIKRENRYQFMHCTTKKKILLQNEASFNYKLAFFSHGFFSNDRYNNSISSKYC